jgi:hypothetical protein
MKEVVEYTEQAEWLAKFNYRAYGPLGRFLMNHERRRKGKRPFTRRDLRD